MSSTQFPPTFKVQCHDEAATLTFDPKAKVWTDGGTVLRRQRKRFVLHTGDEEHPCRMEGESLICGEARIDTDGKVEKRTRSRPKRKQTKKVKGVGTCLADRISGLLKIKAPGATCGCAKLASRMNSWGADGCEVHRDEIVGSLVGNADMLSDAIIAAKVPGCGTLARLIGTVAAKPILKLGANWLLTKSIEEVRKLIDEEAKKRELAIANRGARRRNPFTMGKGHSRFLTINQYQNDVKRLISLVPDDIDCIVGVARSGLCAASMVSMWLHKPLLTLRQSLHDVMPTGNGWRLGIQHVDHGTGRALVVDDTVMTGNSLRAITPILKDKFESVIYASVYVNPLAHRKPDIWAVDLPWPHLLEWNLFNSVISPSVAVDFDGVLCHDCQPGEDDDGARYENFLRTTRPLYVPRKVPIPLIVTARIGKYRGLTEEWLNRWGIRHHRLVMHPAKTLAERNRDNIAAYKARHFDEWARRHRGAPGPVMFVESDDRQAQAIHRMTKRMTVCPHTARVYEVRR